MDVLFSPPLALPIYVLLVSLLVLLGQRLSASSSESVADSSLYASGEESADDDSLPGYRPFFRVALFFAMLHLGVIVLATSNMSGVAVIYLLGLVMILIALMLG